MILLGLLPLVYAAIGLVIGVIAIRHLAEEREQYTSLDVLDYGMLSYMAIMIALIWPLLVALVALGVGLVALGRLMIMRNPLLLFRHLRRRGQNDGPQPARVKEPGRS